MRTACIALVMLSLAACNRGLDNNKEAVRQGVVDYLATKGFNVKGAADGKAPLMTVELTSVTFNGSHADAVVGIAAKGGPAGSAMSIPYKLDQKDGKWVVSATAGAHPGAEMPADGGNPHGGGAMPTPPAGGGKMPSPDDLPPVKKK